MGNGTIIRALSGFYDVEENGRICRCRAKGRFRLDGSSPLVGDRVEFTLSPDGAGVIRTILPRKNSFIRPAVANIDAMVFLASAAPPVTDPFLIDRVSVIACRAACEFIVVLNKCDLDRADALYTICTGAGFPAVRTSVVTGEGVEALRSMLSGTVCAFTGNSGVGKSSLLNALIPELDLEIGEVSDKLGRGRHTTRHVEFYPMDDRTFIADTPGFASFEVEMIDAIETEQLQCCFPDFAPFLDSCRFMDCRHLKEPGCAVLQAVEDGMIAPTRHESYRRLYDMLSQRKPWEQVQPPVR